MGKTTEKGILVLLEPDENVRDALLTLLQSWGWTIVAEKSARNLKSLLENQGVTAVISEATLPDCPAQEILQTCGRNRVPLIFTGHNLPAQDAVDLIRQGGHDYLEKPFQQERLLDLLKGLVNRHNK